MPFYIQTQDADRLVDSEDSLECAKVQFGDEDDSILTNSNESWSYLNDDMENAHSEAWVRGKLLFSWSH